MNEKHFYECRNFLRRSQDQLQKNATPSVSHGTSESIVRCALALRPLLEACTNIPVYIYIYIYIYVYIYIYIYIYIDMYIDR